MSHFHLHVQRVFCTVTLHTLGRSPTPSPPPPLPMPPPNPLSGQLRTSADVYSFGVVLLELLTGRQAASEGDGAAGGSEPLLTWAMPLLTAEKQRPDVGTLLDAHVQAEANREVALVVAILAKRSLARQEDLRPSMGQLVEKLQLAENKQLRVMGRVA